MCVCVKGDNQTDRQPVLIEGGRWERTRSDSLNLNLKLSLPHPQPSSPSPILHLSSALVVSSKIHIKLKHIHRIHIHRVPSFYPSKWTRQKKEHFAVKIENKKISPIMDDRNKYSRTGSKNTDLKYRLVCAPLSLFQYLV